MAMLDTSLPAIRNALTSLNLSNSHARLAISVAGQ